MLHKFASANKDLDSYVFWHPGHIWKSDREEVKKRVFLGLGPKKRIPTQLQVPYKNVTKLWTVDTFRN